jgi:amidase
MEHLFLNTASQLAEKIQNREVSATEVLKAHLEHISQNNPSINAFITLDQVNSLKRSQKADEALARGEIWGSLHGVPVTFKDCFETVGLPTTCGYKKLSSYVSKIDATVVARLKAAGAIVLGKTNMSILASDMQTLSDFGQTNNPLNSSLTAGGSSGGSAAAIAAGFSPLDSCADMGGSGRIPAHFCGIFAIKPTEMRVSVAGAWPDPLSGNSGLQFLYSTGAMARSVEDLKLWLSITQGPDMCCWQVPPISSVSESDLLPDKCRIAWMDNLCDIPITAETKVVLENTMQLLSNHGCDVEYKKPPNIDFMEALETYGELVGTWVASRPIPKLPTITKDLRKVIAGGPGIKGLLKGTKLNMKHHAAALLRQSMFISKMDEFLNNWDCWVCPTVATPAFEHHPVGKPFQINGTKVPYLVAGIAYTFFFTLTGNPVVVLPIGKTTTGLPISIQLIGKRWQDMKLLNLAEKIINIVNT